MKKWKILLFLLCAVFLTACGKGKTETTGNETSDLEENQIYIYYVNADKTDTVSKVYTLDEEKAVTQNVSVIMEQLSQQELTEKFQSPIPVGITYLGNNVEGKHGRIEVSFSIAYDTVEADAILFFKACVVKTLLQMEGINLVSLSLTDVARSNEETATVIENFDQDSFTMSFGNAGSYKQMGTIVLYFANESGELLKEYRKSIEISNTTSLDRLVMESLIEGPAEAEYMATLPKKTTIQNILVKDGICYVDLSDEFYNTDNPLKNDIIVYSIVNSLVELPTVSKVQFLRNGAKQQLFREAMSFDGIFERNLDLIEQEETE